MQIGQKNWRNKKSGECKHHRIRGNFMGGAHQTEKTGIEAPSYVEKRGLTIILQGVAPFHRKKVGEKI